MDAGVVGGVTEETVPNLSCSEAGLSNESILNIVAADVPVLCSGVTLVKMSGQEEGDCTREVDMPQQMAGIAVTNGVERWCSATKRR